MNTKTTHTHVRDQTPIELAAKMRSHLMETFTEREKKSTHTRTLHENKCPRAICQRKIPHGIYGNALAFAGHQ